MEKKKSKKDLVISLVIFLALIGYFFIANWETASSWAIALLGFGLIIFIHELGHFLVARACDIDCEAFSIGMSIGTPYLFGIKKARGGLRVRLLPKTSGVRENIEDDCLWIVTIPLGFKEDGDTEYCLGPLPIGGFVKMKGQDDSGPVDSEKDDDPRSFVNKGVGKRMAVVSAGVIFNVIGAFLLFAGLARYGLDKVPAVVGYVAEDSPAQEAGIEPGDEIVSINGRKMEVGGRSNLDYTHIVLAGILGGEDEPVEMELRRGEDELKQVQIEPSNASRTQMFGIYKPKVLEVAEFQDAEEYYERVGLEPGDEIFAINGEHISSYQDYRDKLKEIYKPYIMFSAKRFAENEDLLEAVSSRFKLSYPVTTGNLYNRTDNLANIHSIVPPLKINGGIGVFDPRIDEPEKLSESRFVRGDVILQAGDVKFPTFNQLNDVVSKHENKQLELVVLRELEGPRKEVSVTVTPEVREKGGDPKIGINPVLAMSMPIIADTSSSGENYPAADLPKAARILEANGEKVSSCFDIVSLLKDEKTKQLSLKLELDSGEKKDFSLELNEGKRFELVKELAEPEPFDDLRVEYRGENIIQAFQLGTYWVGDMLGQSISTIKGLFERKIGADMLSGPIGIARISHRIVEQQDFAFYLYFMGMISCFLAVMNFLPIPVVDGGVFLLLVIEKIKGSPVSYNVQKVLIYIGLALIALLFAVVIFNDISNIINGS
ncbi:Regulator of sigma E protease [Sedimentisphaera cyanobacteriorum]|uniref:Regulator of sigma E protease n=1 Tax=Sedimentisphaera cyanobacteriorum TaxID=1940790 RepID=A0A1Q2HLQ6_9BACT|nr:site-2 protease family protein [Sedimentisphaera cyanobacteriorum]AQQ08407.1 Regulator of sigma E protease [Sedimentisphaera cyanobacteriorum]